MQNHYRLSHWRPSMMTLDHKIEAIKMVFILYAFISGEALYHAYKDTVCQPMHHYVATSELMNMSLKQLTEYEI